MTRKPLRILQVAPWSVHGGGTGGMAAVVRNLTAELRSQGHHVEILANAWHAPAPVRESPELRLRLPGPPGGLSPLAKAKWPFQRERAARRLVALCRHEGADVLHAHYAAPYLTILRRARALGGPPYIVTCHRGDVLAVPELAPRRRRAVTAAIAGASACVAVSQWLAKEAARTFGRTDTVAIPNGFDLDTASLPSRTELEAEIAQRLPTRYAVMVANMRAYKGHDVALKAWARLKAEGTSLPLVLVGNGPDFSATRNLARTLGLDEDDVRFLGYQPRRIALSLIQHATVLVAPSRNEGQGLIILEAGAQHTPVVCSDIAPFTEMVTDGETGYTFPVGDANALARCLSRVVSEEAQAQTLARCLQSAVRQSFSIRAMTQHYEDTFYKITSCSA